MTVQGAPVMEEPGSVVLTFHDFSAVRVLDRQLTFRSAARSVAGMAAILAHEVKNPLSGIRGRRSFWKHRWGIRPRACGADPGRGQPHPRPGGPDGHVQRPPDRAQAGEHPPRAGACPQAGPAGVCRRYPL
ncbi:hypothetical protein RAA17_07050 [Komagataeibacter rhaeticus]|nr:hypothetical protein [Komagataeibacter rhaeticus]